MKRRLFKLAVFLLLGAIVNVAVAWGLAVSVDLSAAPISVEGVSSADPPAWSFVSYRRPGVWSIFAAAATREEDVRVGMFRSGLVDADKFFHHSYPYRQPMPEWWCPGVLANFLRWDMLLTYRGEMFGIDRDAGFDYGNIEVPTLLLHGDDDQLADIAISRYLVTLIPDATLLETPGGSHMLPVTHAAEMADQIVQSDRRP